MPTISVFYGIYIRMYFRDHPPPHFHAVYGEHEAYIDIGTGDIIKGRLPRTAENLVREWTRLHHRELMANWSRRDTGEPFERIAGLDADQGR